MTERPSGPRIGLFGGTFNPIHLGHLRAAEEVLEALELERILFVPSRVPPHKEHEAKDPIASATRRLEWVERAIAGHKGFSIDRIELDRPGPSYLVETLETFRARPACTRPPVFVVGQDAFAEMGDWREPERIFGLADFAVMTRPPALLDRLEPCLPTVAKAAFEVEPDGQGARHRAADTRIDLVPITALDVSSSRIRRACRESRSIRYLVPESIRESIEKSGEYAARPAGRERGGSKGR